MKSIADFMRKVRPLVKNCPTAIIRDAVRDSAIEFCDFTYTWRVELDAERVRDGVSDYDIDAPSSGRLVHVLYVSHSDIRVLPTTERTLDTEEDGWRTSESDIASYYYMPDKKTIRIALTPTTTAAKALYIIATFKPTIDSSELANNLYDDHLEAISHGALMRLQGMDGESWANPAASENRKLLFKKAKQKEKAERLNDYNRESTLTVRPIDYYG